MTSCATIRPLDLNIIVLSYTVLSEYVQNDRSSTQILLLALYSNLNNLYVRFFQNSIDNIAGCLNVTIKYYHHKIIIHQAEIFDSF